MKLFFDAQCTGYQMPTTLISIGIIDEVGRKFYAEFTDYDHSLVTEWIQFEVLSKLTIKHEVCAFMDGQTYTIRDTSASIAKHLFGWLKAYTHAEFWGDHPAYSWVLLRNLLGNQWPDNVYNYPFDIGTLFTILAGDPGIIRIEYAGHFSALQHNALAEAEVLRLCFNRLMDNSEY